MHARGATGCLPWGGIGRHPRRARGYSHAMRASAASGVYVAGYGHHLPEGRITNAQLAGGLDTSEAWIHARLGIRERRRAEPGERASDLGRRALEAALAHGGWRPDDLDLLVCVTSTPDTLIPGTGCRIARDLGVDPASFDLNASCAGFPYGVAAAEGLLRSGRHARAAVVVAEHYTRFVDPQDRATAVFFGDGAAALLLQAERPARGLALLDCDMANLNQGVDAVAIPIGGHFWQDGPEVRRYALRGFAESAGRILERNGLRPADLRAFVGHQASYRLLEEVCGRLGIREEQHWHSVRDCGNQGAAGCATALCQGLATHDDRLADGDLVLLTAVGAGFTSGSLLLRALR